MCLSVGGGGDGHFDAGNVFEDGGVGDFTGDGEVMLKVEGEMVGVIGIHVDDYFVTRRGHFNSDGQGQSEDTSKR